MVTIFGPGGYPFETDEGKKELQKLPDESEVLQLVGHFKEVKLDPREIVPVEAQLQQGACAGHSLSSIIEWCLTLALGRWGVQLSRAYAYYEAQRLDNIRGDRGSTINAGVKLAMNVGIPEESLWRYPTNYDSRRPGNFDKILENAGQYKVGKSTRIQTYEGWRTFLGSGQGGIHTGIKWSSAVMAQKVVESYSYSARSGGHSICGLVLSERLDRLGRPYSWILNSWGKNWMQAGWQEWSPTAIEQMLKSSYTTFVGLSDLPNVAPREITMDELKKKLRV